MGQQEIDLRVWGKQKHLSGPYPLAWHLADTAAVTRRLWEDVIPDGARNAVAAGLGVTRAEAGRLVTFWAGLHDVGKAIPCFQAQFPAGFEKLRADGAYPAPLLAEDMRHEVATHRILPALFARAGYRSGGSATPGYRVAQMLGGHHGLFRKECRLQLRDPLAHFPGLGTDAWQAQRVALYDAVYDVSGQPGPPPNVGAAAAALITGIVILADWLASQESVLSGRLAEVGDTRHGVAAAFDLTYQQAPALLEEAGLRPATLRMADFVDAFGFTPNPLQRSILEELPRHVSGPGLLLITAATGDGKTEAGLSAARILGEAAGMPGLFFALPTMATADEMYRRVRRYIGRVAVGSTPVTLLHSMAWLREAFQTDPHLDSECLMSSEGESIVEAPQWLRGAKRGLLAPVAVGTVDQALMAALALKHNVLRLVGLSGKVLVVDECHAYDPYMQGLLRRLLTWLGVLGCPVVLMSATLPSSIAQSLAAAYVAGGGHRPEPDRYAVKYPGWLYVPLETGEPVSVSSVSQSRIACHRTTELTVELTSVRHAAPDAQSAGSDERLTALRAVLAPVADQGGCVAVVCNTVADAQQTYSSLQEWIARPGGPPVVLDLLHSRYPARERERRTRAIVGRYGKDGERPSGGGIVVATQVIEQSLDLDFDLLVSDLAPLAQLLQRAGRAHRHSRSGRPPWAAIPRLVVLVPADTRGSLATPRHWGTVYPEFLLASTYATLSGLDRPMIAVPGDVPALMERTYNPPSARPGESFTDDKALTEHWIDYEGDNLAQQSLAELAAVPEPERVRELSSLSRDDLTETHATTRMGADSVRALVVYRDAERVLWLDPAHRHRLPEEGHGREDRFTKSQVADLLAETIPVPEQWVRDRTTEHAPPDEWRANVWLRDLILLPHDVDGNGCGIGTRTLRLDTQLGLVRE